MIDVLNLMDGNPAAGRLDERMFVAFGNHEFDQESCEADSILQQRVVESDFYWLHSNLALNPCPGNRPRLVGSNLLQATIVEAFKDCQAEAAFINAGALRLNNDLRNGTTITRRHIEELMQYPTPLYLLELSREQLHEAIKNAISRQGSGGWLQVSRLAFVYDPDTKTEVALFVKPPGHDRAINVEKAPGRKFRVVASEHMTVGTDDGYDKILPPITKALPCKASGTDLKTILYKVLEDQRRIAPEEEGRICTAAEAWGR